MIVCGSPDDGGCQEIVERYGFQYVSHTNLPCGRKANFTCEQAKGDFTHYMITGSDDLISQELWSFYLNYEGGYLGLADLYFYEPDLKKLIYWRGYREGKPRHGYPIGSCILISHDLMEKVGFRPYKDLTKWPKEQEIHDSISKFHPVHLVKMAETGGVSVDIKGGGITRFQLWDNSEYQNLEVLTKYTDIYRLITRT